MKNLKKPLKIGILISCCRSYKHPQNEFEEMGYVERKIVYSWEDIPKNIQKRLSKEECLLFQSLVYNSTLAEAIVQFRKKFGLPEEGVPFKKYEKLICRIGKGPLYRFDTIPEMQYGNEAKARRFLRCFAKENTIADPLKIHLETIFYAGFVDPKPYKYGPLSIHIPSIPDDTTGKIEQYRPPVMIAINSNDVSPSEIQKYIRTYWGDIKRYFHTHHFVSDVRIPAECLHNLVLKTKGKTSKQILELLDAQNIKQGKDIINKGEEAIRQEIKRTKTKIQRLIFPCKK